VPQAKLRGEPTLPNRNSGLSHLNPPNVKNSSYSVASTHQNDFVDWGRVPPPRTIPPAISSLAQGLPFFGKPTNKDYGDFKGLNETPIKLDPSFFKGK